MVLKRIDRYGPQLALLVENERLNPLDAGKSNRQVGTYLESLSVENSFAGTPVVDHQAAMACLAGLWLYHNFFDQAHRISQSLESPEGNFWHAIMHRRERDYGNSKYWFRRVGEHSVFPALQSFGAELVADADAGDTTYFLVEQESWDPYSFVDLCERETRQPSPATKLCIQIQQGEWELLFEHCYRKALGE